MSHGSPVEVFAALGDAIRLEIVDRLAAGDNRNISQLAAGLPVSRQAITKHLATLERAGLVSRRRDGRSIVYRLEPGPIEDSRRYLDHVSALWDRKLARLKSLVEEDRDSPSS